MWGRREEPFLSRENATSFEIGVFQVVGSEYKCFISILIAGPKSKILYFEKGEGNFILVQTHRIPKQEPFESLITNIL